MAVTTFWDIPELKINVFTCLHHDECEADLARCARVHSTWTDLANDKLWSGYTGAKIDWKNNRIVEAIALLPRARRQIYASRLSVLDFSSHSSLFVHMMFDGLQFPRLKELLLENFKHDGFYPAHFKLSEYFQSSIELLSLIDRSIDKTFSWLTASFLEDLAERCPNLKQVIFSVLEAQILPMELAGFFRRIQPRMVYLDFSKNGHEIITYDLLSALSDRSSLETLAIKRLEDHFADVEAVHLQLLYEENANPFPRLKSVELELLPAAVPWAVKCFAHVTSLRVSIHAAHDNKPTVRYIAEMIQLRVLEIMAYMHDVLIPSREFVALGSLSQLHKLQVGTSFFPNSDFTETDVNAMFSGLAALEHLSIRTDDVEFPKYVLRGISHCCPRLGSVTFEGMFQMLTFAEEDAPLFENVKEITFDDLGPWQFSVPQVVRIIDNVAPALETVRSAHNKPYPNEKCAAFAKFRQSPTFHDRESRSCLVGLRNPPTSRD